MTTEILRSKTVNAIRRTAEIAVPNRYITFVKVDLETDLTLTDNNGDDLVFQGLNLARAGQLARFTRLGLIARILCLARIFREYDVALNVLLGADSFKALRDNKGQVSTWRWRNKEDAT